MRQLLQSPYAKVEKTVISGRCCSLQIICDLTTLEPLLRRGPDHQNSLAVQINDEWSLLLHSTVLHMRGDLCQQPIVHEETGDVLLWNGEIFGGIEVS